MSILVVEDETAIRRIQRYLLEPRFEVFEASHPGEARQVLSKHEIHIVLSDNRMPFEIGIMFLVWLAEKYPKVVRGFIDSPIEMGDFYLNEHKKCVDIQITQPFKTFELLEMADHSVHLITCPRFFDFRWLNPTVTALAETIYRESSYQDMPILADALLEAGCSDDNILDHLRGPGPFNPWCKVLNHAMGMEYPKPLQQYVDPLAYQREHHANQM